MNGQQKNTSGRRRGTVLSAALLAFLLATVSADALQISSMYSPRNRQRPRRRSTRFIILHTTEGPKEGSLRKIRDNGEAHYLIDASGRVYRIIHRDRVAFHAGRSMWNGRSNLDESSIGIEVVGYHNKPITSAQIAAIRELVAELQRIYKVPDDKVLSHCMVAYGAPNRWHRSSHRGRKRCGMQMAKKSTRSQLGLTSHPPYDPDVKAKRLTVADPYLAKVLYGTSREQEQAAQRFTAADAWTISPGRSAWDIAGDRYRSAETLYVFPEGKTLRGDEVKDWKRVPAGTKVRLSSARDNETERPLEIGIDGGALRDLAGEEFNKASTIYFLADGRVRNGSEMTEADLTVVTNGTKVLVGYVQGGYITAERAAFDVCGVRWNMPATYYRLPDGSLVPGDQINENAIPKGTQVFFRN